MYDLIIIGSGVAGMTASIYASRYGIKHLIFGREIGGLGLWASKVENYPGYVSIPGPELMENFRKQVERYSVKIRQEEVIRLRKDKLFEVITDQQESFRTRTLILAMGAAHRKLDIPGEEKFLGRGVSYCASCDGFFFKNKVVGVVGGGDSAAMAVVHLADICQKVYLIYRKGREQMRMERAWKEKIERLEKKGKVELILETNLVKIFGGGEMREMGGMREIREGVAAVELDRPYEDSKHLPLDGIFIEIGQVPASALAADLGVKMDKAGYIVTDLNMRTNVPGVFAAGDLAVIPGQILLRQFVTACAEGALAAASAYQFLRR